MNWKVFWRTARKLVNNLPVILNVADRLYLEIKADMEALKKEIDKEPKSPIMEIWEQVETLGQKSESESSPAQDGS